VGPVSWLWPPPRCSLFFKLNDLIAEQVATERQRGRERRREREPRHGVRSCAMSPTSKKRRQGEKDVLGRVN
jgi:hypothetical protein